MKMTSSYAGMLILAMIANIEHGVPNGTKVRPAGSETPALIRKQLSLILSGDIECNPGPIKHPCLECNKPVAKNHRAVMCDTCSKWIHIKCGNISPNQYNVLCESTDLWHCSYCTANKFSESSCDTECEINSQASVQTENVNTTCDTICDRYEHINDSFQPEPDPEEHWGVLPEPYIESDTSSSSISVSEESDISSSDEESDKYDVFESLRNLRKENKTRPVICYININSIRYKFDELKVILLEKLVDILIIAETKIDDSFNDNLFQAEGYKMERRDRTAHGGGLMAHIRADLPFKRRKDLESDEVESICFELSMKKRKWGIIGAYRQPSMKNQTFETDITKCLDKMFIHYENIICLGDLNYDLLKQDKCQPLINVCDNFDMDCIIKSPTCFTKNQVPTLIDVIITNSKTFLCNTINFNCGLSDCHNMIATSLKESCNPVEKKKVTFRSYKNFNEAELNDELSQVPFHVAHIFDDVDDIYWAHETLLRQVVDEHAPLKEKVPKPNSPPYMNSRYRKIIYKTRQARNSYNKNRTRENWKNFTILRNLKTKVKREFISMYFLERCGGGPKSKDFWPTIKPFLSQKSTTKSNSNIILKEDDNLISDQSVVCEKMNDFYINIAKNIGIEKAEPVNKEHPSIKKISENIDVESFNFRPVTEKQVSKCIKKT